jgi:hypothetical protein
MRVLQAGLGAEVVFADLLSEFLVGLRGTRIRLDAHRLPFALHSFEVVVMRQGLHYCRPDETIAEMVRVGSRTVAIGNVVMDSPRDVEFWREYAAVVTPARRVFLSRGQVRKMLLRAGASSVTVVDDWGAGCVKGSTRHLHAAAQTRARAVFERQPPDTSRRYAIEKVGEDITYRVPWEFSIARI